MKNIKKMDVWEIKQMEIYKINLFKEKIKKIKGNLKLIKKTLGIKKRKK